jgi:hypothetical protein
MRATLLLLQGHRAVEVMMRVVHHNERPEFPVAVPKRYAQLAESCWDSNPRLRPTFSEVLQELSNMLADAQREDQSQYIETL